MPPPSLLSALEKGIILADGAIGTEIQARGIPLGRPYPELNLSKPDLIRSIHRDYREAGALFHKTNTFTANRLRLGAMGLADSTRSINQAGVRLAREEAGRNGWVAGSVGPLSDRPEPETVKEAAYLEQCQALAEAGADALLLETFTHRKDLEMALRSARALGLPVIAQVALSGSCAEMMSQAEADVRGMNCVESPDLLKAFPSISGKLRSAFPCAGRPGGSYPLESPAEFERTAGELARLGARLIGGCCGTTPDHIRAAGAALGLRGRP